MKNLKYIISAILVVFVLVSCETYDDVESRGLVNVGISSGDSNIPPVAQNGNSSRTTTLEIFLSEPAPSDLAFTITVDQARTAVLPENYTVNTTVVIPAGERFGTTDIVFTNVSLTVERQDLVFVLSGPDEYVYGDTDVLYTVKRTGS